MSMGRGHATDVGVDDILYGSFARESSIAARPDLSRWQGVFEAGHLPSDMGRVLPALEKQLGVHLCCVWDEYDRQADDIDQAYGGHVELCILDTPLDETVFDNRKAVKAFSIPQDLFEYLYERADQEPEYPDADAWSQVPVLIAGERLVFPHRNNYNALRR